MKINMSAGSVGFTALMIVGLIWFLMLFTTQIEEPAPPSQPVLAPRTIVVLVPEIPAHHWHSGEIEVELTSTTLLLTFDGVKSEMRLVDLEKIK